MRQVVPARFPARHAQSALMFFALAFGCGYKQEDYAPDYAEAVCDLYVDCDILALSGEYESEDDCQAQVKEEKDEESGNCDEYDKEKAEQCIQDLEAMSCDDLYAENWPSSCDESCAAG